MDLRVANVVLPVKVEESVDVDSVRRRGEILGNDSTPQVKVTNLVIDVGQDETIMNDRS